MILKKILRNFGSRRVRHKKPRRARIYSVRRFQDILSRERARAERNGHVFSLVAFALRESLAADVQLHCLVTLLRERMRCFDACGWLPDKRLGMVLPYSSAEEASQLADDLVGSWPDEVPPPHCEIYTYPAQWPRAERLDRAEAVPLSFAADVQPMEILFVSPITAAKRIIDVIGASVGLLVAAPVLLTAAVAIKLTAPGPVFFRQWRAGAGGRPFLMYKLRSMQIDAEAQQQDLREHSHQDGPAFKIKDDPRVTLVGHWLRRTSLDELPQLWNVLKGDMSLVGPRPLPCDESDACLNWQRRRLDVTPGLTCIWQVRGRSRVSFEDWMRMDLEYIAQRSLWQDLKILAATVPAVLLRRGAH